MVTVLQKSDARTGSGGPSERYIGPYSSALRSIDSKVRARRPSPLALIQH